MYNVPGRLVPADDDAVVPPEFVLDHLPHAELDVRRARVPGLSRGGEVAPALLLAEFQNLRENSNASLVKVKEA